MSNNKLANWEQVLRNNGYSNEDIIKIVLDLAKVGQMAAKMRRKDLLTEEIRKGIEWKPYQEPPPGGWGMIAGFPPGHKGARLVHKELNFEVAVCHHRTQIENKELCLALFELFLVETLK